MSLQAFPRSGYFRFRRPWFPRLAGESAAPSGPPRSLGAAAPSEAESDGTKRELMRQPRGRHAR